MLHSIKLPKFNDGQFVFHPAFGDGLIFASKDKVYYTHIASDNNMHEISWEWGDINLVESTLLKYTAALLQYYDEHYPNRHNDTAKNFFDL